MNSTKDCFDRLAKVGVSVENMHYAACGVFIVRHQTSTGWHSSQVSDAHAELMLEAAVLRKHPEWICEAEGDAYWAVHEIDTFNDIRLVINGAPTRLAALTLAAERVAKEKA